MDTDDYCRQIEAHLCRRNEGHLVRIVGPAFELVRGWARRGVPLKVAFQGIDRCVDRANAKGPRRRPVQIQFCDADVLDAFDAWRRAVGVHRAEVEPGDASVEPGGDNEPESARRSRTRESLSTHLDRVIVRLTSLRSGGVPKEWDVVLDAVVRRLDAIHPAAKKARGEARDAILAELEQLDATLMDGARASAPPDVVAEAGREADAELEPFATRLSPDAFRAAHRRCAERVLRERLRIPTLTVD